MFSGSISEEIGAEHVDGYGHLNNSFYSLYFECARIFALNAAEIRDEELRSQGIGLFVVSSFYKFVNQTYFGDAVQIDSDVKLFKARIVCDSVMSCDGEIRARASISHCLVDLRIGRPMRISGDIFKKLEV